MAKQSGSKVDAMRRQREAQYEAQQQAAKRASLTEKPLTEAQAARLQVLEEIVERGLGSFLEVGTALAEIRESKLYRATHGTFERYCQEKWGWSARRGRQLMSASRIAADLEKSGTVVPISRETQARALKAVPREERPAVLERAAETAKKPGKPTAREIREAAEPPVPTALRLGEILVNVSAEIPDGPSFGVGLSVSYSSVASMIKQTEHALRTIYRQVEKAREAAHG